MGIAVYPGSFDPITLGHLDIIKRASKIVDKLIVGVLNNSNKASLFTYEERIEMIQRVVNIPNVEVKYFEGLLVDFAQASGANLIVRGLRAVTDFEYELQMAQTNSKINPNIETIFLTTTLDYSYLSSTIVKEVASYKGNISQFVPKEIIKDIEKKYILRKGI